MRIIRYQTAPAFSPAGHYTGLRAEMDRLFEVAFPTLGHRETTEFPIDLFRDQESFVVRAELPGFRKEDLTLEAADGVLTVTAHRKVEAPEQDKKDGASAERKVSRSISLPEEVKVEAILAKYENGVLTVTLPKQDEAKPLTVEIK